MVIAGVDGYKNGWVMVSQTDDGQVTVSLLSGFSQVMDCNCAIVVVDVPIGLLDRGTRSADREARRLLRRRSCCVFTAPLRAMVGCSDYSEAQQCRLRVDGKGLTKQSWAIMPKIREVDRLLTPETQSCIREGHPEVSFAQMNNGQPLTVSKHTLEGEHARIALLATHFSSVPFHVQEHRRVAEDVIDAYAMLWTARRICDGCAVALPEQSPKDSRGLLMQIWA